MESFQRADRGEEKGAGWRSRNVGEGDAAGWRSTADVQARVLGGEGEGGGGLRLSDVSIEASLAETFQRARRA